MMERIKPSCQKINLDHPGLSSALLKPAIRPHPSNREVRWNCSRAPFGRYRVQRSSNRVQGALAEIREIGEKSAGMFLKTPRTGNDIQGRRTVGFQFVHFLFRIAVFLAFQLVPGTEC